VTLFTLTATGQSHTFKNNKENTDKNGAWGRWVLCTSDIEVKTEPEGIGTYKISFYKEDASHPETVLTVIFAQEKGGYFHYIGFIGKDKFELTANVKLSQMSHGKSGMISIFLHDATVGFTLSNY